MTQLKSIKRKRRRMPEESADFFDVVQELQSLCALTYINLSRLVGGDFDSCAPAIFTLTAQIRKHVKLCRLSAAMIPASTLQRALTSPNGRFYVRLEVRLCEMEQLCYVVECDGRNASRRRARANHFLRLARWLERVKIGCALTRPLYRHEFVKPIPVIRAATAVGEKPQNVLRRLRKFGLPIGGNEFAPVAEFEDIKFCLEGSRQFFKFWVKHVFDLGRA